MFLQNSFSCFVVKKNFHGGELVKDEPTSYEMRKEDGEVWTIIQQGKYVLYVEGMKSHDSRLSIKFSNSWNGETITIGGRSL